MKKTQLLCTFSDVDRLQTDLQQIRSTYTIVYNYIYVLSNADSEEELFVTYNIDATNRPNDLLENTILVHRKKQSNTLYTINALNELIKIETGGVLDKTHELHWELYQNSIVLTATHGIRKIPTEIHEVIDLSDTVQTS